jgi:hypothetical protein
MPGELKEKEIEMNEKLKENFQQEIYNLNAQYKKIKGKEQVDRIKKQSLINEMKRCEDSIELHQNLISRQEQIKY